MHQQGCARRCRACSRSHGRGSGFLTRRLPLLLPQQGERHESMESRRGCDYEREHGHGLAHDHRGGQKRFLKLKRSLVEARESGNGCTLLLRGCGTHGRR